MSDPLDNEFLNFSFTVAQINAILSVLSEAPFAKSAAPIAWINLQGEPQFQQLLEKVKDEPKTTIKE